MSLNVLGGGLEFSASLDDSEFQTRLSRMDGDINRVTAGVKTQGNEIDNWAKKISIAAASYFSINAAQGFVQSLINVRGEFQQIEIAYRTMLKSKAAGDKLFAESIALAAKTPFSLQDVANGSKQLLAYGFQAKDITDTLTTLGNVAAGVGAPLNDIVYLYGTLKTQGRAYQRDIMQFTSRGIPIVEELAKVFGIVATETKTAGAQVNDLVEAGKIGFPEVEKAFNNLTSSSGIFFNLMEEQSKSLTGQLSNLSDAWDVMLNNLGKSQEGILSDGIGAITSLVENYQKVLDIIGILIATYGAYRAALIIQSGLSALLAARTAGLTALEILHYNALVLLSGAQKAYNALLAASPIGAATASIAALGLAIYALTQANNTAIEAQKGVNDISVQATSKHTAQITKIRELIKITQDHNASQDDHAKALKKIIDINPEFLGGLNAQNIATKEGADLINKYLKALNEKALGELAYAEKQKNIQKIIELQSSKGAKIGTFERAGKSLANFLSGNITTNSKDDLKNIVDEQVKALVAANAEIDKKYGEKIKDFQLNGNTIETDTKAPKVRSESFLEEQIKSLKENRAALDIHSAAYADYTNKISVLQNELSKAQGKVSKEEKKSNDEKLKALEDISKAEQEAFRKGLSKNDEEIKSAKDKYDALRKEAKEAGLGAGAFTRIDNLEKKETGSIQYNQNTDKLKAELEQNKKTFADFEAYKNQVGETFATQRYAKELEIAKQTQGKAAKELVGLLTIQAVRGGLTNNQQERLNLLTQSLKAESDLKQQQQDKDLADALNATQTYNIQKKALDEKYEIEKAALLKSVPAAEYQERLKVLDIDYKDDNDKLKNAQIDKQKIFAEYYKGVEDLSDANAKRLVSDTRKILDELFKGGKISKDLYDKISKDLISTSKAIDDRLPKKLGELASSLGSVANEVKGIDSGFGDMLGTLANVVGSVGNIKSSVNALKEAQGSGDLLGGLTAGLGVAGAGIGIITGIFSAINKGKEEQRKRDKEQQEYSTNLQIKAIDAQTKAMERQLALMKDIYGTERIAKYGESLVELQKKQEESAKAVEGKLLVGTGNKIQDEIITRMNNGESDKSLNKGILKGVAGINEEYAKALMAAYDMRAKGTGKLSVDLSKPIEEIERLQQLLEGGKLDETTAANVQSLITYTKQYQDTLNALKEAATGNTFQGIGDEIVDMFSRGETSAEDFGKSFQNIMQKYLLNTFKGQVMDKALQDYYNKFDEFAQSGGVLDANEKNTLQGLYTQILEDNKKKFEQLQEVTGIDLTAGADAPKSNLQGSIKRELTEQTGSELAGLYRAGYDLSKQSFNEIAAMRLLTQKHMDIAMEGIVHLRNIESNTGNTVEKLNEAVVELKNIVTNTKPGQSGRALGI